MNMSAPRRVDAAVLDKIEQAILSIRYGKVEITVHDAQVVQLEKLEKVRLESRTDLVTGGQKTKAPTDRTSGGQRLQADR